MAKRFTDTNKWRDPWYRRLTSAAKQLWGYILDNCDQVGVVEVDYKLATSDCGQRINQTHMSELGDRVQQIGKCRFFIPKFIHFQCGELSEKCPAHKPVIRLIAIHKLERRGLEYFYPSNSLFTEGVASQQEQYPSNSLAIPTCIPQEKEKEKEEETDKEKILRKDRGELSDCINFALELDLDPTDGDWFFYKCEGCGWTNDGKPIKDWKATMRSWKSAGYIFPSQKQSAPNYAINQPAPQTGMDKMLLRDKLAAAEKKFNDLNSQYEGMQTWTPADIAERKRLRGVIADCKKVLGVEV